MGLGVVSAAAGRGFSRPHDLRLLPNNGQLLAWLSAAFGIVASATMIGSTGAPALTVSGPLSEMAGVGTYVQVNKGNAALFDWNNQNGCGLSRGFGQMGVTIPLGSSYLLPDGSNRSLNFAASGFTTAQSWQLATASWSPVFGGSGFALDNSSVYAAKGGVIEAPAQGWCGLNPSVLFSSDVGTGGMGNVSGWPAAFTGNNTPWHFFAAVQPTSLHIGSLPVALFGLNNSGDTAGNFLDFRWWGADATTGPAGSGSQYEIRRRLSGASVTVPKLSGITLGPVILDVGYDGTTVYVYINGQLVVSGAWSSGALTLNRFLLMAQKLGGSGVTNQGIGRVNAVALYSQLQPESWSGAWGVRTALAAGVNP